MDAAMAKIEIPRSPETPIPRLANRIEVAAAALGLSRSRLYELIAAGEIAACKVGRRTIIPAIELTAFLDRHRVAGLSEHRADARTPRSRPAGDSE